MILNEQALADLVARLVREQLDRGRPDPGNLISLERAADRVEMSVSWIRKQIRKGLLPAFHVGACVRVKLADVDALAVSTATPADTIRDAVLDRARRRKAGGQ